jgi:glycosyltransferase involved in cell wall biosynthesis
METYCAELVRALEPVARTNLHVLPGHPDGSPPSAWSLLAYGVRTAWRVLTTNERYSAVHGADMAVWPLVWLAGARRLAPRLILSAHGTDVAMGTRNSAAGRAYAAYLRLGALLVRACLVIANSRATATLAGRFGYQTVKVVPLAARPTVSAASAGEHADPYVAFVGRLIPRKGCAWFIREVLPNLPEPVRLKVAGTILDLDEREALKAPRVDYLGPLFGEKLAELRRNAIAVVVPNLALGPTGFEGFGLTAVEAAIDGGVAVAGRIDGLEDAVIEGVSGFLEPPGDAVSWTARIRDIASWPPSRRAAFVERSREAALSCYNWDRVARDTAETYVAELMPGRR